jgi:hypothetical protein
MISDQRKPGKVRKAKGDHTPGLSLLRKMVLQVVRLGTLAARDVVKNTQGKPISDFRQLRGN